MPTALDNGHGRCLGRSWRGYWAGNPRAAATCRGAKRFALRFRWEQRLPLRGGVRAQPPRASATGKPVALFAGSGLALSREARRELIDDEAPRVLAVVECESWVARVPELE